MSPRNVETYNRRLFSACHLWWFLYTVTISGATANAIRTAPKTGLNITHPRAVASKVVVRAKDTCMLAKPKLSGPRTEGGSSIMASRMLARQVNPVTDFIFNARVS